MSPRRADFRVALVLATLGVLGLCSMLARPTIAGIRTVDLVHLIATGMCLGGALVAFAWARSQRGGRAP